MLINISYDPTVISGNFSGGAAEEAAFKNAMTTVANELGSLFTNSVTINLEVGWGEYGGQTLQTGALAQNQPNQLYESYSTLKSALVNTANASGDTAQLAAVSTLPSTDPTGGGGFAITNGEAKALGLLSGNAPGVDGYVGFSTTVNWSFTPGGSPTAWNFISVAEHEITEEMGRLSLLGENAPTTNAGNVPSAYTAMDLFRYAAPGVRDTAAGGPGSTAYFSYDNGNTNLATWINNIPTGDLGDWQSGPGPQGDDAFDNIPSGTAPPLTNTDVTLMNILGWDMAYPDTEIPNGETDWVSGGESTSGITVLSGGLMEIGSGGSAFNTTVSSGGSMYVDQGGLASSTSVTSVGFQLVSSGGLAEATTLDLALQQIASGGTASGTWLSGGSLQIVNGIASNTTIDSGSVQQLGSIASVTTVSSGGLQYIISGGVARGTTVYGSGSQTIYGHGTASGTILSGGEEIVYSGGVASGTTIDIFGDQFVSSGGTAIDATDGAYQVVDAGGTASGTTVSMFATQDVLSGGTSISATLRADGEQFVSSGGVASRTTVSGAEVVYAGGIASGTTIDSGGAQWLGGGFYGSGGSAVATVVSNGGFEYLVSGGVAIGTTISSGGMVQVYSGSTASNTTIGSGGILQVSSGGIASRTTISNGGLVEIFDGGSAGSNISSGGTLEVFSGSHRSDTFHSGAILEIGSGNTFDGSHIGSVTLEVASGATASATIVSGGGVEDVEPGGTDIGATISGGLQNVYSGAIASNATVSSGGTLVAVGGKITIFGGQEIFGPGGAPSGATVSDGGLLVVSHGGVAVSATVDSGGTLELLYSAAMSDTTFSSGSFLEIASGYSLSNYVTSGDVTLEVASGGTVSGATISSGATLYVFDGGMLQGNVVNDGTLNFDIAGSAGFSGSLTGSGTLVVSGGGALDVESTYAGAAQIDDTSTLEFASTYVGAATFSGSSVGSGGKLKFDAGSTGPITVVNSNDTVIAQPGSDNWINAIVSYTLPTNIDALFLYAGTQGTGNSDAAGDALYALDAGNAQTLTGNSANDTFVVYNSSDVVVPKAGSHDVVYAGASYTLPTGVDTLILEGAATQGVGNSDAAGDALYAANPNQVATLTGNSLNDTFVIYNSSDVVVPKAGSHDLVYSAVNYTLPTGVDSLILEAGAQAVGNSDAAGDTLYAANAGIAQTLTGNSHNDTFVVYNSGDTVIGQAGSTDTVYTAANFTLPANVDTLFLEGNASLGTGNNDAVDTLFGNASVASTLVAGSGADILYVTGAAGTILTGGAGADTFAFPNAMGKDEVTNFGFTKDTLQFNATLFSNFTAAMNAASQVGANTVFTIDTNDTVTLDNVTKTSLTAGNFHLS
jgi:autotransporter passenger strand-loop-strand repeat protein